MIWDGRALNPWAQNVLDGIGITAPSFDVPLHRTFVATLDRLGPGQQWGTYLTAMRFDVVHALRDTHPARRRIDLEHARTRALTEVQFEAGGTLAAAEAKRRIANVPEVRAAEDALARSKDDVSFLRALLDAIDQAVELHRTDRADLRAADRAHADGIGGAA